MNSYSLMPSIEPDNFPVLITTMAIGESTAIHAFVVNFKTRTEADACLFQIANHDDAEGRYDQTAIPLYR